MIIKQDLEEFLGNLLLASSKSIDNWHTLMELMNSQDYVKLAKHLIDMKELEINTFQNINKFIGKHGMTPKKHGRPVVSGTDFAELS